MPRAVLSGGDSTATTTLESRFLAVRLLFSFPCGFAGSLLVARGNFAAGFALLGASVLALRLRPSLWRTVEAPEISRRDRALALLAIAVVAAFFRTHRLAPPGLWGDDAVNGLIALDILDGKVTSPFDLVSHAFSRFHALPNYFLAASFHLFGPGLTSLRVPGVVLNFACVFLLYGTAAPLFGARVALCSALFFATSPMQISHGKIFIQAMSGEFFVLLGMFFLVRGLGGRRPWLTALAGPPLALSLATYHSTKLAPLIAVAFAAARLREIADGRRRRIAWCAAALALGLVAAAPIFVGYLRDPSALTGRIGGTSILPVIAEQGSLWPLWDSFWRSLMAFHFQQGPVLYHWFGIGTDPAVNALVAFLCMHGLVESLLRWRESRHFLLLVWFAVGLLPGVLSSEAPRIYRILLASPPVFVWAALPVARLLGGPAHRAAHVVATALAALVLLAVPLVDGNYYFYRVYTHPGHNWLQGARMVDMARTLARRGPGWTGYLVNGGFNSGHETMRFLARVWKLDLRDVVHLGEIMPVRPEKNALLLVDPSAIALLPALEDYYAGTKAVVHPRPVPRTWWLDRWYPGTPPVEPGPMAAYLALPAAEIEAIRGLTALYLDADGLPLDEKVWRHLGPADATPGDAGPREARRIAASGALDVPTTGTYGFRLVSDAPVTLSIDGRPVLSPKERQSSLELSRGLHRLAAVVDAPGPAPEIHWQPPDAPSGPIPPEALYRSGEVRGWLAEFSGEKKDERRLDPLPAYQFFQQTFDGKYRARWRGRLLVPEDGLEIYVRHNGALRLQIDGAPWELRQQLSAGEHEVDLQLSELEGALFLDLRWQGRSRALQPIARSSFLPPRAE